MKLELIQEKHILPLVQIACDTRISDTSGVPENCNEKDVTGWMNTSLTVPSAEMHFVLSIDDSVCGCCILKKIDWDKREAELSYWLGVDYWGKGLGTKAARLMAENAFNILGFKKLNAHYLEIANAPSGKILQKIGFVKDETRADLKAEGRFLLCENDVWTFVTLSRDTFGQDTFN
ncbi:GNAT family N-acetyltransferase [Marinomonas mediterranea]|jgi:Acetyltransferases, including N-acetylases of ribosomal proteins|uniref:GCN5-related N-acetyltransferase n=1 Tax=Marinomonas mediterranea (strain ATCC 700492 / JCM 21426 / NBRC 103028 / MMB-1) TaxID=717774 RepID=F2JWJ0_MARM1|nr:GNAT family N-acetyltransferase [Marinomonas mediterranea]ADZ90663.1 GCN5-related N-acetyltransferase [Marinomonas mediterranea MMB-1]WCN16831.1 GNAT family N-acetyltransferase [Marinomonas mediterranea MMB-1]